MIVFIFSAVIILFLAYKLFTFSVRNKALRIELHETQMEAKRAHEMAVKALFEPRPGQVEENQKAERAFLTLHKLHDEARREWEAEGGTPDTSIDRMYSLINQGLMNYKDASKPAIFTIEDQLAYWSEQLERK